MKIRDFKRKIESENPLVISKVANDLGYQIGKRVELTRILNGLTQTELANLIGTKQSSISRIESGSSLPSMTFLAKVAQALKTTLTPPEFTSTKNLYSEELSFKTHYSFTVSSHSIESPYFETGNFEKSKITFS